MSEEVERLPLNEDDIHTIASIIKEGRDFEQWLALVNKDAIVSERRDFKEQYEWLKKKMLKGTEVKAYRELKGQFERFLMAILECIGNEAVMFNLINGMRGYFWVWQFCRLLGLNWTYRCHWYEKHEPFGAASYGGGYESPVWRSPCPDISFRAGGMAPLLYDPDDRVLIEDDETVRETTIHAEIKHLSKDYNGRYVIEDATLRKVQNYADHEPCILYWFIVHDYSELGAWTTELRPRDWYVADFKILGKGKPESEIFSRKTRWSSQSGKSWEVSKFVPLVKWLPGLRGKDET